jgi:hypothetical protein
VVSINNTEFSFEHRCRKEIKKTGIVNAPIIMEDIKGFQNAWRDGVSEGQLYIDFSFKPFKSVHKPYKLYEIYAGPNRKNLGYRVVIMFYDNRTRACWIYAFKKQKQNDPDEVNLAIRRADEYWDGIKGG